MSRAEAVEDADEDLLGAGLVDHRLDRFRWGRGYEADLVDS
jgi:hypothetical protein